MAPEPAPRIAAGVELIGRFEGSGFKEPPCIARRADGQMVQMAPLLFALAEEVDGRRSYADVAEALSRRVQRGVTGEMAEMLVDQQLRPLGIVAPRDGKEVELNKVDPLLALRFRTKVVPERVTAALTTVFKPLFLPPVVLALTGGFLALAVWLFGFHGISQSVRHVIYQPALVLMLVGGVLIATAFHEIGHASAVRYGGATPGVMGVGVYIVWPAFYTDITDSYRLGKAGRLRTDLGGMYFNAIFGLAAGGLYALTGYEPLLLLVVLQTFAILQQSLPLLRLDGYYIVSDLTGVPDILGRIRPMLLSLLPWREPDARVTELKSWVRAVVTAYVCVLVPVVAFMFVVMLMNAPRILATGWDSFWLHWDRVGPQFAHGDGAHAAISIFQMLVLVLPAAGMLYTTTRVAHRFGAAGLAWSDGSLARRRGLFAGAGVALALTIFFLWPNGAYRPIQPGERGTIGGAFHQLAAAPTGRPALTPVREEQLGGAPTQRQLQRRTGGELGTGSTQPTAGSPQHVRAVHPSPPTSWDTPDPATGETPPSSTYVAPDSQPAPPPPSTTTTTPTQTTPAQTTPTQTTPTQTTPTDTTPTDTTPTDTTPTDTTPTQTTPPPSP